MSKLVTIDIEAALRDGYIKVEGRIYALRPTNTNDLHCMTPGRKKIFDGLQDLPTLPLH